MELGWGRPVGATMLLLAVGQADAQHIFSHGFEESCHVDSDGDRLSNCVEVAWSTDYNDADTDDDGIPDGDEVLGTVDGLNLPALGVDPRRRDLLVEYDWQDDNIDPALCSPHTHKPSAASIEQLRLAFAAAPLQNPDGSRGINLIQDVGQGGILSGGNFVNVSGATIQGATGGEFQTYKAANLASNRLGYFHYVINTHAYTLVTGSSGIAEVFGDDAIVSLGCSWNQGYIRNTIMHELGHNLGLAHGGGDWCNQKPNYNSVMNYRWQFNGIDTNCDGHSDGEMTYSIGSRPPLDENHLDEAAGMCNTPVDWDPFNGGTFTDIAKDVNTYVNVANPTAAQIADCGGLLTTLTDFNDWPALDLQVLPGGPGGGEQTPSVESFCGPPPSEN